MIVIIDDDDLMLLVMKKSLADYEVVGTSSAEEAVEHAKHCDAAIIDVVMPVPGEVVFERMRAVNPDIKVLFVSGMPGLKLPPGIPLLGKPFAPKDLKSAVARLLS